MNLHELSVTELAQMIRQKKCSSRELVTAFLQQIERVNPKINAIVLLRAEQALQQADELDTLLKHGEIRGPLHGIPFTLKDVLNTKEDIVTAGSLGLKNHVARSDATIVKRLYQAGGILLGKTNTPEFECASDTDNLVFGRTINPYGLGAYSVGGSSGGGAAIVAACGSAFDIGSDIGGSLRVPASHCGVATIRATVGRIPSTGLVYPREGLLGLLFTEGPLTRRVSDLEVILRVISGPDGVDPRIIPMPLLSSENIDVSALKIAYFIDNGVVEIVPEVKQAVKNAIQALTTAGCQTTEAYPQNIATGFRIFREIVAPNFLFLVKSLLDKYKIETLSPALITLVDKLKDKICDLPTFAERWVTWDRYRSDMLQFMQPYDILICPVTAAPPSLKHQWEENTFPNLSYSWAISMAGLPCVAVRAGTSNEAIPIGVQIAAKPWQEHLAIAVAKKIEEILGGWQASKIL